MLRTVRIPLFALALVTGCGGSSHATTSYSVPSETMVPTYKVGDVIDIDLDAYRSSNPKRGDVVVLNPPAGAEDDRCGVSHEPDEPCARPTPERSSSKFVKRIVALPGERVKVVDGFVYVNGAKLSEPYVKADASCEICDLPREVTIPPGDYFMAGDNRGESDDSRVWGPVPKAWILGKVTS